MNNKTYSDYFEVDETYWPCVDESAIKAGMDWKTTYPHDTFIQLLEYTERMLGGKTNRSLWIHGAYGTGKSQCAFALKEIFNNNTSEDEVNHYWNMYQPLRNNKALLNKIIGHKKRGVVTAYRYASGNISMTEQLCMAVQESIAEALDEQGINELGITTLRESISEWLKDDIKNDTITKLLQKPEYRARFSQSSANEIIEDLESKSDVSDLMDNIFFLAAKEGFTALTLNTDFLKKWIIEIIHAADIQIMFIWDEFSDYFRQNYDSLGEFQKLAAICQEAPFYFVIVTHPITSLSEQSDSWKVVQERFNRVEITLPDNIAFELIGHAFSIKSAAKNSWADKVDLLDARLPDSKKAVSKIALLKDESILKRILPIHPYTALILKYIAAAFKSNQRSMFDFIKTPKDSDIKAFQWFIQNYGPYSRRPFITIDFLWNFFYEKGRDDLSPEVRQILDTYPQQKNLNEEQEIVLKAILIMQAIDQRLKGAVSIVRPTDNNLELAFEGDHQINLHVSSIARTLIEMGILIKNISINNEEIYAAAVLTGDQSKIQEKKDSLRKSEKTSKILNDHPALADSLTLNAQLKLRYTGDAEKGRIALASQDNFTKVLNECKSKRAGWRFYAILALAVTEEEAQTFRTLIKKEIKKKDYENIIVIDALSTPLGLEDFNRYIDHLAMSLYYYHNNKKQAVQNDRKARHVITKEWSDRIYNGQFIVFNYNFQTGRKANKISDLHNILTQHVFTYFQYAADFEKQATEAQLKLSQARNSALQGLNPNKAVSGLLSGIEKTLLKEVWKTPHYWEKEELQSEPIVKIKKDLDLLIKNEFSKSGRVSIGQIWTFVSMEYGFSPCNLFYFILGFLLVEYSSGSYRFMDLEGHKESMSKEKLADMLYNFSKKTPIDSYILNLSEEEKAFYSYTQDVWDIKAEDASISESLNFSILRKMQNIGYPIWSLESLESVKNTVDDDTLNILKKYREFVKKEANYSHDIAHEIGEYALKHPETAEDLRGILTEEKCKEGMFEWLKTFDEGRLLELSSKIGIEEELPYHIKKIFSDSEYSGLWDQSTAETSLKQLADKLNFIYLTDQLFRIKNKTFDQALNRWREELEFIGFSGEAFVEHYPKFKKVSAVLDSIAKNDELLPEMLKDFNDELLHHYKSIKNILDNPLSVFRELYEPYLSDLSLDEIETIRHNMPKQMFTSTSLASNKIVNDQVKEHKKEQVYYQLLKEWRERSGGTKNPRDWSYRYRTPILCCVPLEEYSRAKLVFDAINDNQNRSDETQMSNALEYIQQADFFEKISDYEYRNQQFSEKIVGNYSVILNDPEYVRDELEKTNIEPYDWLGNPVIKNKISQLATQSYNADGIQEVIAFINKMDSEHLKSWLKKIAKDDMEMGLKILLNKKD